MPDDLADLEDRIRETLARIKADLARTETWNTKMADDLAKMQKDINKELGMGNSVIDLIIEDYKKRHSLLLENQPLDVQFKALYEWRARQPTPGYPNDSGVSKFVLELDQETKTRPFGKHLEVANKDALELAESYISYTLGVPDGLIDWYRRWKARDVKKLAWARRLQLLATHNRNPHLYLTIEKIEMLRLNLPEKPVQANPDNHPYR